ERAWLEVDRPRCLRTVDATVGVSPLEPDERAYQLAERIARELADLPSTPDGSAPVAEFAARVRAIDPQGLPTTLVERPATSDDGRHAVLDARDQQAPALDADAARAGFAGLVRVGQVSGVLGGRDGFHVVMVTEIIAPQRLEGPELEARLLTAVLASRARPRLSQLLERLRRERPVSIVEAQASWTRRVWQAQ
ncbi:MAG TPA: hypothetical protein VLC09_01040, partial [Polyangiaceae bacterium]|nr:hypothetical protein [Polyangiaceae bacterium]